MLPVAHGERDTACSVSQPRSLSVSACSVGHDLTGPLEQTMQMLSQPGNCYINQPTVLTSDLPGSIHGLGNRLTPRANHHGPPWLSIVESGLVWRACTGTDCSVAIFGLKAGSSSLSSALALAGRYR